MAEEEFEESDVMWAESDHSYLTAADASPPYKRYRRRTRTRRKGSAPVNIPSKTVVSRSWAPGFNYDEEEEGLSEAEEIVPPHVLVVRRMTDRIAFSVCTGNGRTLKGRDLQRVRNDILKMTGFLES